MHGTADLAQIEAPMTLKAYLICAFAAFGGIFYGYDTGWMGGVLAMPYFITQYTGLPQPPTGTSAHDVALQDAFHLPASDQSLVTSILSVGTFFGAIIAGDVSEFIGRRTTIILGCLVFFFGCILETASTGLGLMVPGRLFAGLGVGFISAVVILYMSEIAPKKVRGALVSAYQFCITIGILIANGAVYSTKYRKDSGSYRIPIAVQFIWALVLGLGMLILPESPRYFVKKGRLDRAAKSLSSVRGQPIESELIQAELAEIIANHEYEQMVIPSTTYMGSWANCFKGSITKGNSNSRKTVVGIVLQMMQQLTGINFIFYFGPVFLTSLHTINNPFLITILSALVNTVCTPLAFYAVDKWGRRPLLVWGAAGMVASQYIIGAVGVTAGKQRPDGSVNTSAVSGMIAFIMINVGIFSFTWGPVAWVTIGEIFPIPIRARGVGLSTASNWLWNCVSFFVRPPRK